MYDVQNCLNTDKVHNESNDNPPSLLLTGIQQLDQNAYTPTQHQQQKPKIIRYLAINAS